jgi:acyl-CoA hydrolase
MGDHPEIPRFQMYTEVIQDSVIDLINQDRCSFVSGSSLTLSNSALQGLYDNLENYRGRLLLRPQEITNNPEVVRLIKSLPIPSRRWIPE